MKVMVMDSSGSMRGQISGTSKRDIARKSVREMIAKNPALDAAGLIAYGHRRKGDCNDIETLAMTAPDEAGSYIVRDLLKGASALRVVATPPLTVE